MTERRLVDTNLIVRHLVQDHAQHSKVASELLLLCDEGRLSLVVLPCVLAESVFVLESFYERERVEIAECLGRLIASPGVEINDEPLHLDALRRYAASSLHFVDCTLAAWASAHGKSLATFDKGFKQFTDVKVNVRPPNL